VPLAFRSDLRGDHTSVLHDNFSCAAINMSPGLVLVESNGIANPIHLAALSSYRPRNSNIGMALRNPKAKLSSTQNKNVSNGLTGSESTARLINRCYTESKGSH
jgi:hypothetical protein